MIKEEKPFVAYLAQSENQEDRIISCASRFLGNDKFDKFNCLYRDDYKGNAGFTDANYNFIGKGQVIAGLITKIKKSSKVILIRGGLRRIEDELLVGLLFADYLVTRNKIPKEYLWIHYLRQQESNISIAEREKLFPRDFEFSDYQQSKILKLMKDYQ